MNKVYYQLVDRLNGCREILDRRLYADPEPLSEKDEDRLVKIKAKVCETLDLL